MLQQCKMGPETPELAPEAETIKGQLWGLLPVASCSSQGVESWRCEEEHDWAVLTTLISGGSLLGLAGVRGALVHL